MAASGGARILMALSVIIGHCAAFPCHSVKGILPLSRSALLGSPSVHCEARSIALRRARYSISLRMQNDNAGGDEPGSEEESPAERLARLAREGRAPLGIDDTIEGIPQAQRQPP